MYPQTLALLTLAFLLTRTLTQGPSVPNTYSYHSSNPQTVLSFQGIYGSNFNETIILCNFHAKPFELKIWNVIPVIAQSADVGQSEYNEKGALLANGPYDAAFALGPKGLKANGYYTFLDQKNESTPRGETGPWILYYEREPTEKDYAIVYRDHKCKKW